MALKRVWELMGNDSKSPSAEAEMDKGVLIEVH